MNNGERIRHMTDNEINKLMDYEIIYPKFSISEIRQANNRVLALMLNGCCNHCLEKNKTICTGDCVRSILAYLDSEVF